MDQLKHYQTEIKSALNRYATLLRKDPPPSYKVIVAFDDEHGQYLLREIGWTSEGRIKRTIFHVALQDGKIWIEEDWSEEGIITLLLENDIPADDIVLGFQPPNLRSSGEFAVA
ncbi:MAG: XisI protein [Chloroflexota bacterium]